MKNLSIRPDPRMESAQITGPGFLSIFSDWPGTPARAYGHFALQHKGVIYTHPAPHAEACHANPDAASGRDSLDK